MEAGFRCGMELRCRQLDSGATGLLINVLVGRNAGGNTTVNAAARRWFQPSPHSWDVSQQAIKGGDLRESAASAGLGT